MSDPAPTPVEALQVALAGEHAAFFVYGVLGARTSESEQPTLFTQISEGYSLHRRNRDQLTVLIAAHEQQPVPAEVAYVLPSAADTPDQRAATARLVEERLVDTYGQLIEQTAGSDRRWALGALAATAVRVVTLGGSPQPFPGLSSPTP